MAYDENEVSPGAIADLLQKVGSVNEKMKFSADLTAHNQRIERLEYLLQVIARGLMVRTGNVLNNILNENASIEYLEQMCLDEMQSMKRIIEDLQKPLGSTDGDSPTEQMEVNQDNNISH